MTWAQRMAQGWFCQGGHYDIDFNATATQFERQIVVALASLKAVRDETRDKDGNVTGSLCHSLLMFLRIGLPILICACLPFCYWMVAEKTGFAKWQRQRNAQRKEARKRLMQQHHAESIERQRAGLEKSKQFSPKPIVKTVPVESTEARAQRRAQEGDDVALNSQI